MIINMVRLLGIEQADLQYRLTAVVLETVRARTRGVIHATQLRDSDRAPKSALHE